VKWFENRQRLQPDRDPRHRGANVGCGNDAMDTWDRERRRGIHRVDMPVGYRAAQDRGVQQTGLG